MKSALVLIIAAPGDLQDGLLALMTTTPQVKAILIAEGSSAAQRMLEIHTPALALLDMNLAQNGAWFILKQIKSQWPAVRTIAIAGNTEQKHEAETAGADIVLLYGFQATKLISVTEELLSQGNGDVLSGLKV